MSGCPPPNDPTLSPASQGPRPLAHGCQRWSPGGWGGCPPPGPTAAPHSALLAPGPTADGTMPRGAAAASEEAQRSIGVPQGITGVPWELLGSSGFYWGPRGVLGCPKGVLGVPQEILGCTGGYCGPRGVIGVLQRILGSLRCYWGPLGVIGVSGSLLGSSGAYLGLGGGTGMP